MVSQAIDTFARDNLPALELWPQIDLSHPAYEYPDRLNCVTRFIDRWIDEGHGDAPAFITSDETLTYADIARQTAQLAHVLVDDFGLVPGNRVLLRAANKPMMVGLPIWRSSEPAVLPWGPCRCCAAKELNAVAEIAEIKLALCDEKLAEDMKRRRRDDRRARAGRLV